MVVSSIAMILITNQFKCHMIGEEESMCLTWLDRSRVSAQGFHDVEEYCAVCEEFFRGRGIYWDIEAT